MFTQLDVLEAIAGWPFHIDQPADKKNGLVIGVDVLVDGEPTPFVIRIYTGMTLQPNGEVAGPVYMDLRLTEGPLNSAFPIARASLRYSQIWEVLIGDKLQKLSEEARAELAWRKHKNGTPACTHCGSRMKLANPKSGGNPYWKCCRSPGCHGTRLAYRGMGDFVVPIPPEELGLGPEDMPGASESKSIADLVKTRKSDSNW